VPVDFDRDALEKQALELAPVQNAISGRTPRKIVVVPNRIVNVVV
jgi:leucyl-tRNA synthetase